MADVPSDVLKDATRLRRLVEHAETPDLRETARRDLERLVQQHAGLREAIQRRFPGGRPDQF